MDRDANYVAVGAFVLLVIAMAGSFVYWYTAQRDIIATQRYEIYFQGTVSGLSPGSPVRYLGVDVGKVARIGIDPQRRDRVQVIADIDTSAPINARTRASLSLQGITGLLYVDLEQDRKSTLAGPLPQGQSYPMIASVPSDFDLVLSSLPALAVRATELIDRLNQVFDERSVQAIKTTLEDLQRTGEQLPGAAREARLAAADLRLTLHRVDEAVAELRSIESQACPDVAAAVANVRRASDGLADTADRLDRFVAANGPALSRFAQQSLPELDRLLRESRDAARDFRDLSRSLKRNPSQLLYEAAPQGVEVSR